MGQNRYVNDNIIHAIRKCLKGTSRRLFYWGGTLLYDEKDGLT